MISEPSKFAVDLAQTGADQMTFHYESQTGNIEDLISKIKQNGMKAAIAIKPSTLIDITLEGLLNKGLLDMVLVMTVGYFIIK